MNDVLEWVPWAPFVEEAARELAKHHERDPEWGLRIVSTMLGGAE